VNVRSHERYSCDSRIEAIHSHPEQRTAILPVISAAAA
jgi:hypothetical protein